MRCRCYCSLLKRTQRASYHAPAENFGASEGFRTDLHSFGKDPCIVTQHIDLGVSVFDFRCQLSDLGHAGEVGGKAVDILVATDRLDALGCSSSLFLVPEKRHTRTLQGQFCVLCTRQNPC